jgi:hypothetical protein
MHELLPTIASPEGEGYLERVDRVVVRSKGRK